MPTMSCETIRPAFALKTRNHQLSHTALRKLTMINECDALDVDECFGAGQVGMEAAMKRVTSEHPQCGDCVISRLLAFSKPSAFLQSRGQRKTQWEQPERGHLCVPEMVRFWRCRWSGAETYWADFA